MSILAPAKCEDICHPQSLHLHPLLNITSPGRAAVARTIDRRIVEGRALIQLTFPESVHVVSMLLAVYCTCKLCSIPIVINVC